MRRGHLAHKNEKGKVKYLKLSHVPTWQLKYYHFIDGDEKENDILRIVGVNGVSTFSLHMYDILRLKDILDQKVPMMISAAVQMNGRGFIYAGLNLQWVTALKAESEISVKKIFNNTISSLKRGRKYTPLEQDKVFAVKFVDSTNESSLWPVFKIPRASLDNPCLKRILMEQKL